MSNTDIVRSYADAWNAHDAERVAGHFTADGVRRWQVVMNPLIGGPTAFQGTKEIASGVATFMEALPDLVVTAETAVETDEGAILEWRVRGTHTGAWGGWVGQGESVDLPGVSVYRMDGGKIVEERMYFDPDMMARNWTPPGS
jgi:steroid delta-isomerase-like uncharacterized protein